jgi:hypothetical protein
MGLKTGVGGTAIPLFYPPPPKWHPLPPGQKALYVGLENGLGIGEGVPLWPAVERGPHPPHPVGTVQPVRNPLWDPQVRHSRRGWRQSRSGRDGEEPTKVAGDMSMGMEDFPLPDEAAGRRGMASRSMS